MKMDGNEEVDDLPLGSRVGPYVVVEHLGRGGMGQVFLGNDVRLHRKVALKRLHEPKDATGGTRARILHEARAAAQINHPNVATIHDVIEHESRAFIVMEYVEGETLSALMRRGRLPFERVIAIGRQLASALAAAHARGVIHRDLKPANIQVTADHGVKVLDFGVAGVTSAFTTVSADGSTATAHTPQPGTRGYMSPEQMMGGQVDERTDVFSLGIVLFEMATGERAYPQRDVLELLAAISRPVRRADAVDGRVPREFADVIAKALDIDVATRFQTAAALDAALGALQPRLQPAVSRRQMIGRALVGAALLAVAAVGAFAWWRAHGAPATRSIAVLPLENLSAGVESQYFSDGMTDLLTNSLAKIKALHVISISRTSTGQLADIHLSQSQVAKRLNVDGVLEGSVQLQNDRVRVTLRVLRAGSDAPVWADTLEHELRDVMVLETEVVREVARALNVVITPQEEQSLAKTRHVVPEAQDAYLRGRSFLNRTSREGAEKATDLFEEAIRLDKNYTPAYAALATAYLQLNAFGVLTSEQTMGRARLAIQTALALNDPIPEVYTVLGDINFVHDWKWTEAEAAYQRAIDISPSYAYAYAEYAWFLASRGRLDTALQNMYRAEEADPLSLLMKSNVAGVLYYAHEFDAAIAKCQQIVRIDKTFGIAHRRLMQLYTEQGKFAEALAEGQLVLDMNGSDPGALADFARAHALAGHVAEAERLLDVLTHGPTSIGRVVSPDRLAFVHAALGHRDQAFTLLQRAIDEKAPNIAWLGVDPHYDSLHNDVRFGRLLEQLSFSAVTREPGKR